MKDTVRYPCVLCGNPDGKRFFYYTAKKVASTVSVSRGVTRDTTTRTTTYRDVTRREGFVCKACRKKGRWKSFFILLAVATACFGLIALLGNDFLTRRPIIGFALGVVGIIAAMALIPSLVPANGSRLLVDYYKQHPKLRGVTYMTEGEASNLKTSR